MVTLEQWGKQLQNTRGILQNFRLSYVFKPAAKLKMTQILPVGVMLKDFLGCKYSRWGGWWGDCSFLNIEPVSVKL